MGYCWARSLPMPTACEPWPGKMNAIFVNAISASAGAGKFIDSLIEWRILPNWSDVQLYRRGMKLGQTLLDLLINAPLGEFGGDPHCVLDGVRVGGAVRDNAHSPQSQQRRATVFRVIDALLEVGKCAARKHVANLPGNCGFQGFFEHGAHQIRHAFGDFERHIAYEAIGNDYVDVAVEQVASLYIAHKVQGQALQ